MRYCFISKYNSKYRHVSLPKQFTIYLDGYLSVYIYNNTTAGGEVLYLKLQWVPCPREKQQPGVGGCVLFPFSSSFN